MEKTIEQFQRTKRWFKRFEEIQNGRSHTRESEYYQDIVYAFFQNCWHIKDWILNSTNINDSQKSNIKAFFYQNTDMKICRDIANGTKHLTIKKPSIDPNISFSKREYSIILGGGDPHIEVRYWIQVRGFPPLDAFHLAGTLMAILEGMLKKRKFNKLIQVDFFYQIFRAVLSRTATNNLILRNGGFSLV